MFGFNVPSDVTSYAYVSCNAGISCTPNSQNKLTIDSITHVSDDFTAVLGEDHITYAPGAYIAFGDVYATSVLLASGYIQGWPVGDASVISMSVPCMAAATDNGAGMGVTMIVAGASGRVWVNARQSDTVNRALSGDLLIIKLGSN